MTISMATKAHGAAATTLMLAPWISGVAFRIWREIHRAPQEAKETPSSLSASVSCRRLSCQNTTATARYSRELGMIAEMENTLAALAAAHNPKRTPTASPGIFQALRCEYSCAPRKKSTPESAKSQ